MQALVSHVSAHIQLLYSPIQESLLLHTSQPSLQ